MDTDTIVRIALISLFPTEKFNLIGESHGICCISGYLSAIFGDCVKVELFDQQIHSEEYIVEKIDSFKPHIIGYSLKMGTYSQFESLYSIVKNRYSKNLYSVVGNSFAHFNSSFLLHRYPELIVSIGEGEVSFNDLVKHIQGNLEINQIRNIIYKDNGLTKSHVQEYLNPNLIPIADRRYSKKFYDKGGEIYIEGSRGCGYCACSICECRYFLGSTNRCHRWRPKSISKVINEINILLEKGINEVTFSDEDFFGYDDLGYKHVKRLVNEMRLSRRRIEYRINARTNSIARCLQTDKDLLIQLKDSGLVKIFLGFESGSISQLKRYGKGGSLEVFLNVAEGLNRLSIEYELGFIPFDPLVTFDELCETYRFLEEHNFIDKVSSVIKELRIQGGNRDYLKMVKDYEQKSFSKLLASYDYNSQLYPIINYADPKVNRIIKLLREYSIEKYSDYYSLRIQTQYTDHKESQKAIRALKLNDFNLIKELITIVSVSCSDIELKETIDKYNNRRTLIYKEICQV